MCYIRSNVWHFVPIGIVIRQLLEARIVKLSYY